MYPEKQVNTLFRYYGAAVHMRDLFRREVNISWLSSEAIRHGQLDWPHIFCTVPGLYLTYWYSNLYLTIEGWRELGFEDAALDTLLESPYVERLRRFRNATFHFHKDLSNPKHVAFFINDESNTELWLSKLHYGFNRFFQEHSRPVPPNLTVAISTGSHAEVARAVQAALGVSRP